MKENLISKLAEEVVKGYFENGDIIELLQAANRKLKKEGSKNEIERR
ncbi:hypothetical protein [Clostridium ihumii]|nr:hypothetical protein [Clostridium ihumii]